MDAITRPWQADTGGLILTVRLTPRGGRDAIEGITQLADGRSVLKVRVRVAPSEGEANAALVRLMAKALGVPARQVSLVAGANARIKRLQVTGAPNALASTLEYLCVGGSPSG